MVPVALMARAKKPGSSTAVEHRTAAGSSTNWWDKLTRGELSFQHLSLEYSTTAVAVVTVSDSNNMIASNHPQDSAVSGHEAFMNGKLPLLLTSNTNLRCCVSPVRWAGPSSVCS
mgnify:FL=1